MIKVKENSKKILSYKPEMIVQVSSSPIAISDDPKYKNIKTYSAYKLLTSYKSKYKSNFDFFFARQNVHQYSGVIKNTPDYFKLVPTKRVEGFRFYKQDKKCIYLISDKLQSMMIFDKPSSNKKIVPKNYFDLFDSSEQEVRNHIKQFGFFPLKPVGSNSFFPMPYDEDSIEDLIGDVMKFKHYLKFEEIEVGKIYITSQFSTYHHPKVVVDKDDINKTIIYRSFRENVGLSKNFDQAINYLDCKTSKLDIDKFNFYKPTNIDQFNSLYKESSPEKIKLFKEVVFSDKSLMDKISNKYLETYKRDLIKWLIVIKYNQGFMLR